MVQDTKQIIVLGASITGCPWFTWKDFVQIETGLPMVDLSSRGVGNEYMTNILIKNSNLLKPGTMVIVMFTNFDKFDWYVENARFSSLEKEKHVPKPISEHSGFWCTGSHFPLDKRVYRELFYTHDYFCAKTIQQILLLQRICDQTATKLVMLFDSPIWQLTEQDINQLTPDTLYLIDSFKRDYLSLPLSGSWCTCLDPELREIQHTNFLGFCWANSLQWYNSSVKTHPPSSSHWQFYQQVVRPMINQYVKTNTVDLNEKIKTFDKLWHGY